MDVKGAVGAVDSELRVLRIGVVDWLLRDGAKRAHQSTRDLGRRLGRIDYLVYSRRRNDYRTTAIGPHTTVYPTRSRGKPLFFADAWRLGKKLQQEIGYDLVTSADPMGAGLVAYWLRQRFGLPWLVACHSDYYSSLTWRLESPRYWFDYFLSVYLLRRASRVMAVSHRVGQEVIRLGVAAERVTVLPNIRQTNLFTPGQTTLQRYQQGRLIYAGRLAKEKGLPTLLCAVRLLADDGRSFSLKVVGSGPMRHSLEVLSGHLRISPWVEFVDRVPQEELAALYQSSSALVLPSNREAFGWVVVEAGLCGLGTIATDVGGVSENVVEGQTGLLVPPRDPKALAGAIGQLLSDPAMARRLGQEACSRYQAKWDYERLLSAHVALLREVAGGG